MVNVGGEWFYEEYARGAGVSSLGLEDKAPPTRRARRSATSILDLFQALSSRSAGVSGSKRSGRPACALAHADSTAKNSPPLARVDPAPADERK